jgi:hypothetical protein
MMTVQTPPAICFYNYGVNFALSLCHTLQGAVRESAVAITTNTIPAACLYRQFSRHASAPLVSRLLSKSCHGRRKKNPGKVGNFQDFENYF